LHRRRTEVVVKVAALAAVLVLGSTPVLARDGQQAPQATTPTFRSSAALVALNVTVQDRGARFVLGLQPADFVVYEDGVKQNVQFFESTRVPVDLIVLIDTSTSMRDKLDVVHDAASGFLKTLRPEDRGAVVSFANTVTVLQPLTSDQALLQSAIAGTQAGGNTCLNNAVYIALKEFGQSARQDGEVRRQAIVMLSDGADTASVVSFDDVLGLARRMGVSIYTVSLQSAEDARRQAVTARLGVEDADYTMKTLAKETGAQAFFPAPAGLRSVYASIASELASQYSIGYVPANGQADGRFRRVNVQVVTRPDLQSRTRLGYTAGGAHALSAAHGAGGEK
jgi:Ca-activated chloride channel family protein